MKMLLSLILILSYAWIHVGSLGFADEKAVRCAKLLSNFQKEPETGADVVMEATKVRKGDIAKRSDSNESRENVQRVRYVEDKIPAVLTTRTEVDQWVSRLLFMDAHTIQKANGKEQIFLGYQLADNSTIQFEYTIKDLPQLAREGDATGGTNRTFSRQALLAGIRFIPSNLEKTSDKKDERAYPLLVKKPLKSGAYDLDSELFTDFWVDPGTGGFRTPVPKKKDRPGDHGANETLEEMTLKVIPVLHGPVLEKFLRYKDLTELLTRVTVVNDLSHSSSGIARLRYHGVKSRVVRLLKDRTVKKVVGIFLVVLAITAYYKLPGYYQEFIKPSMDQTIPSQVVTGADYNHFAYISGHFTNKWSEAPSFVAARESLKYSEAVSSPKVVEGGIKKLAQLISREKEEKKGDFSVLVFDEGFQFLERLKGDRRRDAFKEPLVSPGKGDSFFLVGTFKESGIIFLSKVHYKENQDKPFWISYLTIDQKLEPELFGGLTTLIQSQAKAAKEVEAKGKVAVDSDENLNLESTSTSWNLMNLFSTLNPLTQVQSLMNSNTTEGTTEGRSVPSDILDRGSE